MYSLSIAISAMSWRMLYQDEDRAKAAFALLQDKTVPEITLTDDFGQVGVFRTAAWPAIMLEDMDKSKVANVELALHQQRVQLLAQKMVAADPGLRAGMGGGSPILSPMGNGGFRPQ